jgi:hypothetical protein
MALHDYHRKTCALQHFYFPADKMGLCNVCTAREKFHFAIRSAGRQIVAWDIKAAQSALVA